MSYPSEWWIGKPVDPYANDKIYLSDGTTSASWFFKGDPKMIITYEEWLLVPKPEYKIEPLPFMMSNAKERANQALDKANDRHIHYGL